MKRKIIKIIEEKCNGCGVCQSSCVEGAIQIIKGKARLINEVFCDGLGACLKECPQGAIIIEERKAKPYNEIKALKNVIQYGEEAIKAHLKHLKEHGQTKYYDQAREYLKNKKIKIKESEIEKEIHVCPHSKPTEIKKSETNYETKEGIKSELSQWPIQFHLINPSASYFKDADVVIAADCAAFAYGDFHRDFIKGKKIIIGCPKLDSDLDIYKDKIKELLEESRIKSLEIVTMEVPCCFGLIEITKQAISKSKHKISFKHTIITIEGEIAK